MADNHSKEIRSMNMSHIRSTNSKPEEVVRKYLFARGFRYQTQKQHQGPMCFISNNQFLNQEETL